LINMGNKIISFFILVVFLALTTIASNASEASVSDTNPANLENLTEQANIMAVRQAYVDFSKGDVISALDKFAENAEWVQPGGPQVPLSGNYQGKVQIAGFFLALNTTLKFTKFDINEYIAKGNEVVVIGSYQALNRATEKTYSSDFISIFTIDSGKFVRYETYHDTAAIVLANALETEQ